MSLSNWEQFVKANKLTADYESTTAAFFVSGLESDCNEAFDYINETVDLLIDHSETRSSMMLANNEAVQFRFNVAYKTALNAHIQEALDNIDDEQSEFYQEGVADRASGLARQTEVDA